MESKYKIALIESFPYLIAGIVIGLAFWLQALIRQDTITLTEAEIYGGIMVGVIIASEVLSLYLLKLTEVEKRQLTTELQEKDKKIEEFEKKYREIKKIN